MADENAQNDQKGHTERKKRNVDGKKSITFVYTDMRDRTVSGKHRTAAFSVDEAWKEYIKKHNIDETVDYSLAFAGHIDPMSNKIRKPTRAELLKLAGLSDDD